MALANNSVTESIVVQNNSLLVIPDGLTLTITSGHDITIELISGVLIQSGGALIIIAPSIQDFDGDGIFDNVDSCPSQPENYNGYQDTDGCPDTPPISPDHIISIEEGSGIQGCEEFNECFFPFLIEIIPGDAVSWINNDSVNHTVVSGTPSNPSGTFNSEEFSPGNTFVFTFNTPGIYSYYCSIHPWMVGQIAVEAEA